MKKKEEKYRKQDNCQPISINLVLKTVLLVVGYIAWGIKFVEVALSLYIALKIIRLFISHLSSILLVAIIVLIIKFII